ncbi:MAG: tetratricopeptide repeat protein [Limisphaerales bacterium]
MKRVAFWLFILSVALAARAQSPDAEFLQFYSLMQQGETLERSGQQSEAMERYQTAHRELQQFAKAYPKWNEKLIQFRLTYLTGKLGSLAMKKVEPASPGASSSPSSFSNRTLSSWTSLPKTYGALTDRQRWELAENRLAAAESQIEQALRTADEANARANQSDERTARLALDLRLARDRVEVLQATEQNLSAVRTRLETERTSLQARLKEALAPKPAALDPAQLARAQERNLLLTKENEILKACLDRQMEDNKRLVETAARALELEKQLDSTKTELASLRHENNDLRDERQRLAARVEALGKKIDPSSVLLAEIESLQRELAEARRRAEAADPNLESLRAELADQKSVASRLRSDNATLARELEKLTAIKVTPASLKASEMGSVDFTSAEVIHRVRRLERERDELREALEQAQGEINRRASASAAQGAEMGRKLSGLEARIASLEAQPEPYTPEELALFQAPSRATEAAGAARGSTSASTSGTPTTDGFGSGSAVLVMAQATPPKTDQPSPASEPAPATTSASPPPAPLTPNQPADASASGSSTPPAAAAAAPAGGARRRTLRDLPSGASILAAQAQRAFAQRRFDDAEKAYREILTLDERNVFTLGNLAAILVERGRLEESEVMLKRALEVDPEDPFSLSLQGIIRFRQQRYDEAFEALSRSAQLDPENADTQNYLGITLSQRGQRKAAEAALRKALKLSPSSPAAHYNLAVVYATQKPPYLELARYHYEKARRSGQPPNPAFEGVLRGEAPPSAPAP